MSGTDSMEVIDRNIEIAANFTPMGKEEREALIHVPASEAAGDGRYELFKSTRLFDNHIHRSQHQIP